MPTNALDLSSLNSFDPTVLNLLDEPSSAASTLSQQTATSAGDSLASNYGFRDSDSSGFLGNFRTIASNPMFMSLSTYFDEPLSAGPAAGLDLSALASLGDLSASNQTQTQPQQQQQQKETNSLGAFDIDFSNLTTWPTANGSTDDLFAATWGNTGFSPPSNSTFSMSPIVHQSSPFSPAALSNSPSNMNLGNSFSRESFSASSGSGSSSTSAGASPASHASESNTSVSDMDEKMHNSDQCPKTKGEFVARMVQEGPSPFAPPQQYNGGSVMGGPALPGGLGLSQDANGTGKVMTCTQNSHFPITEKSDQNVEITSAWRSITNDPNHKVGVDTLG